MGGVHHSKKRPNPISPQQVLSHLQAEDSKLEVPDQALLVLADHTSQILADASHPLHSQLSYLAPPQDLRGLTPLKKLSQDALEQIAKCRSSGLKKDSISEEENKIHILEAQQAHNKSPIRKVGHVRQEEKEALKRYTSQLMSQLSFLSSKYNVEEELQSTLGEAKKAEKGLLKAAEGDLDDALLAKLEAAFRDYS